MIPNAIKTEKDYEKALARIKDIKQQRGKPLNNSVGMRRDRAIRKGLCEDQPALRLPGIGEFPGCAGQPSRNKPGLVGYAIQSGAIVYDNGYQLVQ